MISRLCFVGSAALEQRLGGFGGIMGSHVLSSCGLLLRQAAGCFEREKGLIGLCNLFSVIFAGAAFHLLAEMIFAACSTS